MVIVGIWVGVCCGTSMPGGGQIFPSKTLKSGLSIQMCSSDFQKAFPSQCMQMTVPCAYSKCQVKNFVFEFMSSDAKLQILVVFSVRPFLIFAIDPTQTLTTQGAFQKFRDFKVAKLET